ncbi:DUF1257 domain-containing protein [Chamaesiphon minutus]|uniref:DUF1257 domain-containing protein n=1 Tax=Chamaesiphon minutus (strain ATCC 27169 / PCC 6605) TaxID=1173020 RepID=K9UBW0_CHAP6|nr:DUF1257 domain-containing protein [Chamaesiphon minutus]AFY92290.1 Protein of unknown function (DUF1257) [Chamaesiphon minutus PCC 6605]
MSHFTTIKVQIKNGEVLANVLAELGHKVETNAQVRGYQGDRINAEYVIRRQNGYDIGFRKDSDDNYELIADFWGTGINQVQFVNEIQQKYAHKMLLTTAETQGYTIEAEEVLNDGTVRVVVGRWV